MGSGLAICDLMARGQLTDEIRQEQLAWAKRRLEALDKMEAKLREMRALAVYAANRSLSETEVVQVQEWMDILQAEVVAMDKETAWAGADALAH